MAKPSVEISALLSTLDRAGVACLRLGEARAVVSANAAASALLRLPDDQMFPNTLESLIAPVGDEVIGDGALVQPLLGVAARECRVRLGYFCADGVDYIRLDDVSADQARVADVQKESAVIRDLMSYADIGKWSYNPCDGNIIYSEWVREKGGYHSSTTHIDMALVKLHPDDREKEARTREQVAQTGGHAAVLIRLQSRDEGWRWLRVHSVGGAKCPDGRFMVHTLSQDVTELVRVGEKAADMSTRLERALSAGKLGVFEVDLRSGNKWFSPRFQSMIGKQLMDRCRGDVLEIYHPDDRADIAEHARMDQVNCDSDQFEARLDLYGPEEFWVRVQTTYERDSSGKAVRFVGVMLDINDERRQIQALKVAQQETDIAKRRLEMTLEAANVGVFEHQLVTGKVWASPNFQQMVGKEALVASTKETFGLYHPDDRELVRAFAAEQMNADAGTRKSVNARIYRTDGVDQWVQVAIRYEKDDAGRPIRVIGLLVDIQDSKLQQLATQQAMESAETANARLGIALRAAKAGAYEVDMRTGTSWWSPEIAEMVGANAVAELEKPFGGYHPDDTEAVRAAWGRASRTGEVEEVEARIVRDDGEDFWVRVYAQMDKVFDQGPRRATGLMLDINEQKRQQMVLIEAKSKAEAAAVAKSNFLAAMSHEIRTPLNGVLGMAQALRNSQLDRAQSEQVDVILESGASLMSVLNDVLDLSKVDAGKMTISLADEDVLSTALHVAKLFEAKAAENGIELIVDLPSEPIRLRFDSIRVRQCLSNLMSNAVKFTDGGRIELRMDVQPTENDRRLVAISVADTGIGIEPDKLETLFAAFTQADDSTSRKFGGTGLGLTIARSLAQLMGGDISVESELGHGSTFTLTFVADAVDAGVGKVDERAESVASAASDSNQLSGLRVLLVDDNLINRKVATIFLGPLNAHIVEAENGLEALNHLAQEEFDIVLLDVHMPIMDGKETIRHIRNSTESWRNIPVIAVTAHAMKGDADSFISMGMDECVAKPVDQRELLEKIGGVLNGARAEAA